MQGTIFFSLILFFNTNTLRAESEGDEPEHITGAVRIKRSSISDSFAGCIYELSADNCLPKEKEWNDLHCVNNSLGFYNRQAQFMNLGAGPLGVKLGGGFLQYVTYIPFRNTPRDQEDETRAKKIMKLVEERARMEMKAMFFESQLNNFKAKIKELKARLATAEEKEHDYLKRINSLTIHLEQWQQGATKCQDDMESGQKKSSIALEVASSHISQLENDNAVLINANKQLTETVTELRTSCNVAKSSRQQCVVTLSECDVKLGACKSSERELQLSLEQQIRLHEEHLAKDEIEYNNIQDSLSQVRQQLSVCTVSLEAAKNSNDDIRKSRDTYVSRLSGEIASSKQCNDDLRYCRANRSASADLHDECRSEISRVTGRFSHMQDQYMKCSNALNESKADLGRLKKKNAELSLSQANKSSQLEKTKQQNSKLEARISEQAKHHETEKIIHKNMENDLHLCQKDLRNVSQIYLRQRDEINEINQNVHEINELKASCIKDNEKLMKDMAIIESHLMNMEGRANICQKQLNKYRTDYEKLQSMSSYSKSEFLELQRMYTIAIKQNKECMTHHNVTAKITGNWKNQYVICSGELRNLTESLMKCEARKTDLEDMIKDHQKEEEMSLLANENLLQRVRNSTSIIAKLSKTVEDADRRTSNAENENTRLIGKMKEKVSTILILTQQHTECKSNYSQSLESISELQEDQRFNSELIDSLRKQAKQTSDRLIQSEKIVSEQVTLLEKSSNSISELRIRLAKAEDIYSIENERRLAIDRMLQHCRGNHTEAVGESHDWQIKSEKCNKRLSDQITTHEKELEDVQKRLRDMIEKCESVRENQMQVNVSLQQCEQQQDILENEGKKLQHRVKECKQKINFYLHQVRQSVTLKLQLKQMLDSCTSDSKDCSQQLRIKTYKLDRCNERIREITSNLELSRNQLEQCNAECRKSKLSCPEGPSGETYVITTSGCLMQSSILGSKNDLENYCHEVKGNLMTLQDSDQVLNVDVIKMLEYFGKDATSVWITRPNQNEEDCFSVDMSTIKAHPAQPVAFVKTPCGNQLPGICSSALHGISSSSTFMDSLLTGTGMTDTTSSSYSHSSSISMSHGDAMPSISHVIESV